MDRDFSPLNDPEKTAVTCELPPFIFFAYQSSWLQPGKPLPVLVGPMALVKVSPAASVTEVTEAEPLLYQTQARSKLPVVAVNAGDVAIFVFAVTLFSVSLMKAGDAKVVVVVVVTERGRERSEIFPAESKAATI